MAHLPEWLFMLLVMLIPLVCVFLFRSAWGLALMPVGLAVWIGVVWAIAQWHYQH